MALLISVPGIDTDLKVKVVIIGDSGVGKTNLLSRFTRDAFNSESKPTIGVEFDSVDMDINGRRVKTQLWDTAGADKYRAVTNPYYSGAGGVIIVYDITKRTSFTNVPKWLTEVREKGSSDMIMMLVGNKYDMRDLREVSISEGREYAEQNNLLFMEASAQDSTSVATVFRVLVEDICDIVKRNELLESRKADQQQARLEELTVKSQSLQRGSKLNPFKQSKQRSHTTQGADDHHLSPSKSPSKSPKVSKKLAIKQMLDLQQQKDKMEEKILQLERERNKLERQVTQLRVENEQLRKSKSCESLVSQTKSTDNGELRNNKIASVS